MYDLEAEALAALDQLVEEGLIEVVGIKEDGQFLYRTTEKYKSLKEDAE